MRHPLYVANTLVALGCALLSGTWYLPVIVVLLSFIYHERIAAREEAFLQSAFGDSFRAWASEVPAMIPAFGRYRSSNVPFQFRKVMVQESHGLCAIGTAFLVLDTLEDSVRLGYFHVDPAWLAIFAATLIPFLAVVIAKRAPAARARREAAERERAGVGPASIDKSPRWRKYNDDDERAAWLRAAAGDRSPEKKAGRHRVEPRLHRRELSAHRPCHRERA